MPVMRARPHLLAAWLTLGWFSIGSTEASGTTRAQVEAQAIFLQVFKNKVFDNAKPACQVSTSWLKDTIPESMGRERLGLTIHADLAPLENAPEGEAVLKFTVQDHSQLCTDYDAEQYYIAQLNGKKLGARINLEREFYTFPVFNASYTRAIFISGGWLRAAAFRAESAGVACELLL